MLSVATEADLPAVVRLMNVSFRGHGATAGWNTESAYIDGDRTTEALLRDEQLQKPAALLLVWREADGGLSGCVWLEPVAREAWYLGSLSIKPQLQNAGWGRKLLAAAECWAAQRGAAVMRMSVVNVRDTLIAWYERRGYHRTGETLPFPYGDNRFGTPKRDDLAFVVLEKTL